MTFKSNYSDFWKRFFCNFEKFYTIFSKSFYTEGQAYHFLPGPNFAEVCLVNLLPDDAL